MSQATGTAEREIALAMIDRRRCAKRITLGADKAYDVTQFVHDLPRGNQVDSAHCLALIVTKC
ncbi:hypothetical protein A1D31_38255 [Bradyrhizobium liaoningense]|nr:hypothetical protein A1D31_38255 [Bradyrhizobium liaoningense]